MQLFIIRTDTGTFSVETKAAENLVESYSATAGICSSLGRKSEDRKLGIFEEIILGVINLHHNIVN